MLDVHVIPVPGFDVRTIVGELAHPLITVHVAPWAKGMWLARTGGYALGAAPFVTWVDGDDRVLDVSWVERALTTLELEDTRVSVVYPRFEVVKGSRVDVLPVTAPDRESFNVGTTVHGHHLSIMRRSNVEQVLPTLKGLNARLDRELVRRQLDHGIAVLEPTIAYRWVLRPGSSRTLRG